MISMSLMLNDLKNENEKRKVYVHYYCLVILRSLDYSNKKKKKNRGCLIGSLSYLSLLTPAHTSSVKVG